MSAHIDELLAQSLEEGLSAQNRERVEAHLQTCARCRLLEADLMRTEGLLTSTPRYSSSLPPLLVTTRPAARLGGIVGVAAAATLIIAAAAIGNALNSYRQSQLPDEGRAAATPAHVVSPSPTTPSESRAVAEATVDVLVARPRILDRVPGGGVVFTSAWARFDAVSLTGAPVAEHEVRGVAVGAPAFDGADRVAYWRQETIGDVRWDLVIWEIRSGSVRVALSLTTERPSSEIIWSAARDRLLVSVQDQANGTGRLIVLDPMTGTSRDLVRRANPPAPLYADDEIVAAVSASEYEVIGTNDGATRTREPMPDYGLVGASEDGILFGLVTEFEAPSGPIRLWRATSIDNEIAEIAGGEMGSPLFRPGRSELFFVSGFDVRAIEYETGAERTVLYGRPADTPTLIAFDTTGEHLLFRDARGLMLFTEGTDEVRPAQIILSDAAVAIGLVAK